MSSYSPLLTGRLPIALPPMLRSNIPGTWAYDTMSRRIAEDILPRIVQDNVEELSRPTSPKRSYCLAELSDLKANIESGKAGFLTGLSDDGPDIQYWDDVLNQIPSEERNWLDAPWVVSEYYFYRRVASAFKFFETGYDMFINQKFAGLQSAVGSINDICSRLPNILSSADKSEALTLAIQTSLWGNKIDLSLWPANKESSTGTNQFNQAGKISSSEILKDTLPYILDDQTADVVRHLLRDSSRRKEVGIVVDNAGYELFSDLLLGYVIIELGLAESVVFHTKGHPTFVSDATTEDCLATIYYLLEEGNSDTKAFADKLGSYLNEGKFQFISDLFWCQPTAFWDMPKDIQNKIANSKLVFVKGDANYRRLLGERDWPLETNSRLVLSYWPVPVCALRTLKAEIGCGISIDAQRRAESADKKWKVSGRWGVVQFGGQEII